MLKRTLSTALAAAATLAFAASAQAAYLNLGTSNTSNATTTLTGSTAGSELLVKNTNGASASAFGLYALLSATSPTASAAAVRAQDSSTNASGYGLWASHAGAGKGVYGTAATGAGIGVFGKHLGSSGTGAGVQGASASASSAGVLGQNSAGGPGLQSLVSSNAIAPLKVNSTHVVPNLHAANSDQLGGKASSAYWQLGGNAPGTPYATLGSTDTTTLELIVNGSRALRLEPTASTPNVIAGFSGNGTAGSGAEGVMIAGGGLFGYENRVTDHFGTVGGGIANTAGDLDADASTATHATVGGGQNNSAKSTYATVGGGFDNSAIDSATVGGGYVNQASGSGATVAGGSGNTASGGYATVGGGNQNAASTGSYATVGGGFQNHATGGAATVPGGSGNTAGGEWSFAAGANASATHKASFVWGDASGNILSSNGDNTVSFASTGGARFVTSYDANGDPFTGVTLAANGGSWASLSDRAAKRNLVPVDHKALLRRLNRVPISRWSYKAQKPSIRHLGPMAQDFHAAFALGEDKRHIDSVDSEGVALAAIQGLYRQNRILERRNHSLSARMGRLERQVRRLATPRR